MKQQYPRPSCRSYERGGSRRRSRSRDRSARRRDKGGGRDRRRSGDSDDGVGGYVPRKRIEPEDLYMGPRGDIDPFAHMRQATTAPNDPLSALRQWQEQQLRSRLMVLEQQAQSAVAAASKVQRETYVGNLVPGTVNEMMVRQVRGKDEPTDPSAERDPCRHVKHEAKPVCKSISTSSCKCLECNSKHTAQANVQQVLIPSRH